MFSLQKRKGEKAERKLTNRTKNDDNHKADLPEQPTEELDPRIVAIVRFLARRAAERDFAKAAAGSSKKKEEGNK